MRRWCAPGLSTRDGPTRFYGPVMVTLGAVAMLATAVGQSFLLGQFKEPIQAALSITGPTMAGVYLAATLMGGLCMIPAGAWADRWGLRRVYLVTLPALALVCVLTASAQHVAVLALGFLGLRTLGQGVMELLSGNTVSMWYRRRLGRASIVSMLTFAVSLIVLPPVVQASIQSLGWRVTFLLMGAAVLTLVVPVWLAYVDRPEDIGQRPDGESHPASEPSRDPRSLVAGLTRAQAARTAGFWVLLAAMVYYALALTAVVFCVNSVLADRGLPPERGAWLISALGAAMALSYPVLGCVADRWSTRRLQSAATATMMLAVVMLLWTHHPAMIVLTGALVGLAISTQAAVGATAWVRWFGRRHLGAIRGVVQTAAIAGSSAGPMVLEAGHAAFTTYDTPLLALALAGLPVLLAATLTRPPNPPPAAPSPRG